LLGNRCSMSTKYRQATFRIAGEDVVYRYSLRKANFSRLRADETDKWLKVARFAGITIDDADRVGWILFRLEPLVN